MIAMLSSKGQITIPVAIRELLGIKTGDSIDFIFTKNETIEMIPAHTHVQALRGLVPKPKRPVSLSEMDAAIAMGAKDDWLRLTFDHKAVTSPYFKLAK
jgi:antitoxin PrlF